MCKKVLILIILIVLLFISTGCGYGEYRGNVIDKKYTPAKTTWVLNYPGKMTTIAPIHHNEKYEIEIQKEENEEIKTTWITVSEEQYKNIQIGDYYEEGK